MNPCEVTFQHLATDTVSIEAVVAGTFCLMSCSMQTGSKLYVKKIIDNLDILAGSRELSSELRGVCRRLAGHWQYELDKSPAPDERSVVEPRNARLH
jgi:hypothetical protein